MSTIQDQYPAAPQAAALPVPALELTLRAEYALHGVSIRDLQEMLHEAVLRAIGNGGLTGSTAATVSTYSLDVRVL
ncbi:hypothetical protein [Burkholderia cepacia]|uniref:hypothetical protein n=1 Tax=Burkholderia cepacia TaxID=292 RepID=UPI002AB66CD8|nr:hypothetical protein [Burkholderia cepacia]